MADNDEDSSEQVIRVEFTISPSWANQGYTDKIEIAAAELEGLEGKDRDKAIEDCVVDAVNNVCPWGWAELGAEGAGDGE